jgi:hypothetical protein
MDRIFLRNILFFADKLENTHILTPPVRFKVTP